MLEFMTYNFDISKILLAMVVPVETGKIVHRNRRSHGLVYMIGGIREYRFFRGPTLVVPAHEILYLPKFSDYEVVYREFGECLAINFDLADEGITFPPFQLAPANLPLLIPLFEAINHFWNNRSAGYELKCKSLLYELLYELQRGYRSQYMPAAKHDKIRQAVAYIEQNYLTEEIRIAKLAALSNMTPEYFRRLFKEIYLISPLKYINNLKIAKARELLSSGMFSVAETAAMTGFDDVSYFCRVFKEETTCSPTAYRKRPG